MGSTNCPETPRQRMIGMMYLVLTAMLALNVSKDILDAFVTVDEAMVKTNANFDEKVNLSYAQFAAINSKTPEKTGPFFKKALEVQKKSKELIEFITNLKFDIIAKSEGIPVEQAKKMTLREIQGKDKYDVTTNVMLGSTGEGRGNGKGKELRDKIETYKAFLLSLIEDPKLKAEYDKKLGLDTKTKPKDASGNAVEWEIHNFFHIILAADVVIFNKLVGEVKNAEFDMLTYLMSSIDAGSFKFDKVDAKVIPESKLVFSGTEYLADIIVAASDTRQSIEVYYKMGLDTCNESMIPGMTKLDGPGGIVQLKLPAGGTGEQKFAGMVKLKAADGDKYYPFKSKFTVTKPMANISADSLRILYDGIDNLITIAAPVATEKLRPNFGGCTAQSLGAGRYNVKPPKGARLVTISVSADMGGRMQNLGGTPFRVKRVPDPLASSGGRYGGRISKGELAGLGRVAAGMSPDFPYPLRWVVSSFVVSVKSASGSGEKSEYTNNGPMFDSRTISLINSSTPGARVMFSEIQCSNPILGSRQTLNSLSFKIR